VIFFASAICGAAANPIVLRMFGARWEAAVPVFAILTLMAPVTALYGVINPLLTAAGRTQLVSYFAWVYAASIMLAAWFAAPFGLTVLAWALAGRGLLGVVLFIAALKLGLDRPVTPILRLLALPCLGLVAARLAAYLALASLPGLDPLEQFVLAVSVSAASFALIVLIAAPGRIVQMSLRLHRALLGAQVV
jgi:O-antigen/teichoic acid export membrane protein